MSAQKTNNMPKCSSDKSPEKRKNMKLILVNNNFEYETAALTALFFGKRPQNAPSDYTPAPGEDYIVYGMEKTDGGTRFYTRLSGGAGEFADETFLPGPEPEPAECERMLGVLGYKMLERATGLSPDWGILTGVRPIKLFHRMLESGADEGETALHFGEKFLLAPEKIKLALATQKNESILMRRAPKNGFSLYISIPFCPSRCSYCSFVSHSIERMTRLIEPYVDALVKEIECAAHAAYTAGLVPTCAYVGGGTPSVLTPKQLERLLGAVDRAFGPGVFEEYTVEAGRPETVTPMKLEVLRAYGVGRISINPQTFEDSVLAHVGRKHTSAETVAAYELAKCYGFDTINTDIIAGLPTDTAEGFARTLATLTDMRPHNITVHTLAFKRAADTRDSAEKYDADAAGDMVKNAHRTLGAAGYEPYYLYRQKNTLANLENTGYTLPGHGGIYNVLMMDDRHTVIGAGAGAVTKLFDENSGRLERVFNYKYPHEYLNGFEQIIKRKEKISEFFGLNSL